MPRVVTNFLTFRFAREASLGVLPGAPQWFELEPNSINNFGNTIGTTARSPISKVRARRKGVVTDLDSGVEFEADLTLTHLRDFAECFCFSRAVGPDSYLTSASCRRRLYGPGRLSPPSPAGSSTAAAEPSRSSTPTASPTRRTTA
jgi:hypothetical protein